MVRTGAAGTTGDAAAAAPREHANQAARGAAAPGMLLRSCCAPQLLEQIILVTSIACTVYTVQRHREGPDANGATPTA